MNAIEYLLEIPKRFIGKDFLIDANTGEKLTYDEFYKQSCATAVYLQDLGLKKGDYLAILANNSVELAKLYFGCLYAGIVTIPINPLLSKDEIDYIVLRSNAKALVFTVQTEKLINKTDIDRKGMNLISLTSIGSNQLMGDFVPFNNISETDLMTIVYTSGTTAKPRGVIHSISSMIQNACLFNEKLGITEKNRFYNILSMTYLGGYYNLLVLPYLAGSSVVLSEAFNARSALNFWLQAKKYAVNTLWLVPTIMSILLEMDRGKESIEYCREKVVLTLAGTAPLPVRLRKEFENKYGVNVFENYGLSETFFISSNTPADLVVDGSVGRIFPGLEVRIEKNQDEGEIYVNSPYLMNGYYNPELGEIEKISRNESFPTGDIGILNSQGYLFITGRKKDLIIRGGINISPAAIEEIFYQHPAILECAVVGVPHQIYGEEIAAVVRLKDKSDFKKVKTELIKLGKDKLGSVKQPGYIVEIDKFPLSSSGKIQKNKVRELLVHKLELTHLIEKNVQSQSMESPITKNNNMISGRIRQKFDRVPKEVVDQIKKYPVSIISDCLNRLGSMDAKIASLVKGRSFCGTAFTIEEVEAGNLMSHKALAMVEKGDVLVIDAKGTLTRSCWGGIQTKLAIIRGVVGLVINGTIRDYEDIVRLGLPVFSLGTSPGGPLKEWGGNINYPIACGGVVVKPGDLIAGDDDGVVVVPNDLVRDIIPYCEKRLKMEESWIKDIDDGKTTMQILKLDEKLKSLGIEEK